MREADIEKYLVAQIEAAGGLTAKMTVEGRRGWPDRLVLMPVGVTALVELKHPKRGALSAAQKELHGRIEKLGIHVHRLRSVEDVDRLVRLLCLAKTTMTTILSRSGGPSGSPSGSFSRSGKDGEEA
jgi:hypothetical protein